VGEKSEQKRKTGMGNNIPLLLTSRLMRGICFCGLH
jgi:hypothetical protein